MEGLGERLRQESAAFLDVGVGEARRYLEEHSRQAAPLATLNSLADAISCWDADRSAELVAQLRNELVTLP